VQVKKITGSDLLSNPRKEKGEGKSPSLTLTFLKNLTLSRGRELGGGKVSLEPPSEVDRGKI